MQYSESQPAEVSVPSLVTPISVGGSLSSLRPQPVQLSKSQPAEVSVPSLVTPISVGGTLSSLTAGLQRVASQENNSDDDYD